MSLTKDQILAANDSKIEVVDIPEWGGEVRIRTMTGSERDSFEASCLNGSGKADNFSNIRARLAVRTLCDAEGKRLFTDAEVMALGKKSAAALDRVFAVSQRLNGIGDDDVEGLVKNSEAVLSDDSG